MAGYIWYWCFLDTKATSLLSLTTNLIDSELPNISIIGFERMKHNPQGITTEMQLYFWGESLRNTPKSLELLEVVRNIYDSLKIKQFKSYF